MRAEWLFTIIFFVLIFPVFLNVYLLYDSSSQKVYFSVNAFGINVIGGYITKEKQKIYLHINNKTAKILKLNEYLFGRKKLVFGAEIYSFNSCFICGINQNLCVYLSSLFFLINQTLCPIIKSKKEFLKLNNDLALVEGDSIKFAIRIKLFINLLTIILLALQFIFKEVLLWKNKIKTR